METTLIHLEIEGLKERVKHAMLTRSKDFDAMIERALDEHLTPEKIEAKVNAAVKRALDNAINDLSDNYRVREAIQNAALASLNKAARGK